MSAADAWAEALASWAIPPEILAEAPEDPWAYPVGHFIRAVEDALVRETPSVRRALAGLPVGGTVLDVGCGAGAASLPLGQHAGAIVGVDQSGEMLDAFAERAGALGIAHYEIEGRWPDVAERVVPADVVVCHHVLYNVPALVPFAHALSRRAQRRVVIEITAEHPRSWESALWRELHRIERPLRPTADDAIEVLSDIGYSVSVERWARAAAFAAAPKEELVAMVRVDLCLPAERDAEIARVLEANPPPPERGIVTLWWDVK
ncbi:MAG: class I SAM-dependent methyltransferase [Actinomycetota bacterium]